jgi:hypothetical protein
LMRRRPPTLLQAVLVIMNIMTSAKGATIGLLVSLVVSLAPWRRITVGKLAVGAAFVCLAIVIGFVAYQTVDSGVLSDGPLATLYGSNLKDEVLTINGRVELWKTVVPLLSSSLFLGFGLDGARELLLEAFDWSGNSHNAVFELILAAGLPGALLFLSAWAMAFVRAMKLTPADWRSRVLAVHVYLIITSFASPIWTTSQYISVFFLTIINATAREPQDAPGWDQLRMWTTRLESGLLSRLHLDPHTPPHGPDLGCNELWSKGRMR